jgi:hypothetical protein
MPWPVFVSRSYLGGRLRSAVAYGAALVLVVSSASSAETDKVLKAVRGTVGYQTSASGPFTRVIGRFSIPDDYLAVTQDASNALLQLPDSSEVALGAGTVLQVGAFNAPTSSTPTTITLNNGTFRFNVRHPSGGQSNYIFRTPSSQIAVRGTIGLISSGPQGDQITCLACDANDVTVTTGGQQFALLTGQTLTVSAAAAGVVAATTATMLSSFSSVGLSTSATSASAFTEGIGEATAGAVNGTVIGIAAGAAAVGVIAGVGISSGNATMHGGLAASPSSLNFSAIGQTQGLAVTGVSSATATSSNPSVATVSGSGTSFVVTAVGAGTTSIVLSGNGSNLNVGVVVTATNFQPSSKTRAPAATQIPPPVSPPAAPRGGAK